MRKAQWSVAMLNMRNSKLSITVKQLRNRVYNLETKIKVRDKKIKVLESILDNIHRGNLLG